MLDKKRYEIEVVESQIEYIEEESEEEFLARMLEEFLATTQ